MKCSEIIQDLSLYADGMTPKGAAECVAAHLDQCPLCRQKNSDYLQIKADLRHLKRPEITFAVQQEIKRAIRNEINPIVYASSGRNWGEWLQMRVMPYAIGFAASILIGSAFLGIMLSGMLIPAQREVVRDARSEPVLLARNLSPDERRSVVSPVDFVNSRMAYSSESPSINPEGALMALTRSMVRDGMKGEEVVVVADVFSNGLAQIAEVVESPSDSRTMAELDKAFRGGSTSPPFVPAVMENRPENMRIVLRLFQSVDVETNQRRNRRRS